MIDDLAQKLFDSLDAAQQANLPPEIKAEFAVMKVEALLEAVPFDWTPVADYVNGGGTLPAGMLWRLMCRADAQAHVKLTGGVEAPIWDAETTYAAGDRVLSGLFYYVSIADGNVGNTPASSIAQWSKQ